MPPPPETASRHGSSTRRYARALPYIERPRKADTESATPATPVASPRGLRLDETCVPVESAVHHPRFHIATHNGWNGSGRRGARVEPRLGRVRRTGVTTRSRGEASRRIHPRVPRRRGSVC